MVAPNISVETVVSEVQSPCDGFETFIGRFVQSDRFGILLHASARYGATVRQMRHTLSGIQLRFMFFQVCTHAFGVQSILGGHLCRGIVAVFEFLDSFAIFLGCGTQIVFRTAQIDIIGIGRGPLRSATFEYCIAMPCADVMRKPPTARHVPVRQSASRTKAVVR